jgi:hypothetical protein
VVNGETQGHPENVRSHHGAVDGVANQTFHNVRRFGNGMLGLRLQIKEKITCNYRLTWEPKETKETRDAATTNTEKGIRRIPLQIKRNQKRPRTDLFWDSTVHTGIEYI